MRDGNVAYGNALRILGGEDDYHLHYAVLQHLKRMDLQDMTKVAYDNGMRILRSGKEPEKKMRFLRDNIKNKLGKVCSIWRRRLADGDKPTADVQQALQNAKATL